MQGRKERIKILYKGQRKLKACNLKPLARSCGTSYFCWEGGIRIKEVLVNLLSECSDLYMQIMCMCVYTCMHICYIYMHAYKDGNLQGQFSFVILAYSWVIKKDNNNNKKNLKWGLNPQEKKCPIYWSLAYLAQSKGIMRLLLCSERLWLDRFWHNRLAYWNRNITVRWICSWLQKWVCLNRNVPCNLLKCLLWVWKSGLLGKTYTAFC